MSSRGTRKATGQHVDAGVHEYFEYGGKLQPVFAEQRGDNYGCQNNTVTRTATFFTYTQIGFNGNYLGREDKFSIRVYTEEDWAGKKNRMTKIFC